MPVYKQVVLNLKQEFLGREFYIRINRHAGRIEKLIAGRIEKLITFNR